LAAIAGTVQDNPAAPLARVGLSSVTLQIQDLTQGATYWDGNYFIDNSTVTMVIPKTGNQGTNVGWNFDTSGVRWVSGRTYRLHIRAGDMLDNRSTLQTFDIKFDSTPPVSISTKPAAGEGFNSTTNILRSLAGTAYDLPNATTAPFRSGI